MYHDVYGEQAKARELFGKLPNEAQQLDGVDFRGANAACPFGVDVAAHMAAGTQSACLATTPRLARSPVPGRRGAFCCRAPCEALSHATLNP